PQDDLLGGSASFIATAASYFTNRVSMIAVVGQDFPTEHLDYFDSRGIDTSGIEHAQGKTFRWRGKYSDDLHSRETLATELGVFADFSPKLGEQDKRVDLLFLGNIDPDLQREVVEQADRPGLVAADTMNFWIEGKPGSLEKLLGKIDSLLLNDEEAMELAGEHNLVKAAQAILKRGPKSVVIKRGDSGALLFYEGGVFAAPAMPLEEVRDPTGAGDSFAGGFMGYLAFAGSTEPPAIRAAMINGSAMASFAVEQFSIDGIRNLTPEMIQERVQAFYELTTFERIAL
ncbi:MAG: sugar kinase, partial [Deltaproteobacteria bacterium]|nr:sugar kinase [Deltaproteobacteria bacterium]